MEAISFMRVLCFMRIVELIQEVGRFLGSKQRLIGVAGVSAIFSVVLDYSQGPVGIPGFFGEGFAFMNPVLHSNGFGFKEHIAQKQPRYYGMVSADLVSMCDTLIFLCGFHVLCGMVSAYLHV